MFPLLSSRWRRLCVISRLPFDALPLAVYLPCPHIQLIVSFERVQDPHSSYPYSLPGLTLIPTVIVFPGVGSYHLIHLPVTIFGCRKLAHIPANFIVCGVVGLFAFTLPYPLPFLTYLSLCTLLVFTTHSIYTSLDRFRVSLDQTSANSVSLQFLRNFPLTPFLFSPCRDCGGFPISTDFYVMSYREISCG